MPQPMIPNPTAAISNPLDPANADCATGCSFMSRVASLSRKDLGSKKKMFAKRIPGGDLAAPARGWEGRIEGTGGSF